MQKVARDKGLVFDRLNGLTWDVLSERYDLSDRQCRNVVTDWLEANVDLDEFDPMEFVRTQLARYEIIQGDLALTAERSSGNARVGARRAQMDAMVKQTELLQATGALPKHLGMLRVEHDVRFIIETVQRKLDEHGIPEEIQEEITDVFRERRA